jgi:DNA-binding response OmpR family regulator
MQLPDESIEYSCQNALAAPGNAYSKPVAVDWGGTDGEPIALTTSEFALLHALAQRAGRVLGREQLLQLLHGSADEAFDRSIDVVVSRLRHKLEDDPRNPQLLKTIRGAGYMLAPGASAGDSAGDR